MTNKIQLNSFKFLHAADIHLDSPLSGLEQYEGAPVNEIRSATRRAFDKLIELAIEEEVAFLLLAGDLYDGDWKDYNTGLYFTKCMSRLHKAGIRVFMVAGNHDASSQITKHLRLPDNVRMFATRAPEQIILEDLNVAIVGQGFAKRSVTEDLSLAYPQAGSDYFNIGLLHTCLNGKPGHEPYAPCTVEGLRTKGYQYWALGHVHKREVVSEDPWIVFPGNIQGRHIRECGAKGCTLVTVDDREVSQVAHHDLDVLRWTVCELDMTSKETVDEVYEQLREVLQDTLDNAEGRPVAVRLILTGACSAHAQLQSDWEHWIQEYRSLATGLGGAGIWLEKVSLRSKPAVSIHQAVARDDGTAHLLRAIQQIEINESDLEGLLNELKPLRLKLPAEILVGDEPFNLASPQLVKQAVEDIQEYLINRLLSSEQGG